MKKKFFDLLSNAAPFLLLGGILGLMTPHSAKASYPGDFRHLNGEHRT
ncbi:hypothetical protein PYX08_13860 [Citrobacter freundii]|nr:hypothetical protein [Citrobacter freundii]